MTNLYPLLKALFIFSFSFPLIYLIMFLEDRRKYLMSIRLYKEQGRVALVHWEAYLEWQKFNQRHTLASLKGVNDNEA